MRWVRGMDRQSLRMHIPTRRKPRRLTGVRRYQPVGNMDTLASLRTKPAKRRVRDPAIKTEARLPPLRTLLERRLFDEPPPLVRAPR